MEVQPHERYREQMEVQFEPKPQELPMFEKRIHLPPAQPQPPPPPPPPFVKTNEKPRFSQVIFFKVLSSDDTAIFPPL